jgi:hypothetical protein
MALYNMEQRRVHRGRKAFKATGVDEEIDGYMGWLMGFVFGL